jgi:hypothetical protein
VVELRPVRQAARAVTDADLDWLASRRVPGTRVRSDAGALVSRMRDDEER